MASSSDIDSELNYPEGYILPTLFSTDAKGKERIWKIWANDNTVTRIQGLTLGKKQTYIRTFEPKNVGKKNETSPEEQAKRETETKWVSQIDKGYLPRCKEGVEMLERVKKSASGGHNLNAGASIRGREHKSRKCTSTLAVDTVKVEIKPMKANVWEDTEKCKKYFNLSPKGGEHINNLDIIQPKYDGIRCVARIQKNGNGEYECVLTTNNKKQFPWFQKLRGEVINFLKGKNYLDGIDCELYAHTIVDDSSIGCSQSMLSIASSQPTGGELDDNARFQAISGICSISRSSPHPLEDQIKLIVFDLVDLSGKYTQMERMRLLENLFINCGSCDYTQWYTELDYVSDEDLDEDLEEFDFLRYQHDPRIWGVYTYHPSRIILSPFRYINDERDIYSYHDEVAQEGFEGVIIRSRNLKYTDKRTLLMRKYKKFIDAEYPIIGVEKDNGVDDEYFVWVCHDPSLKDKSTGRPPVFKAKPKGTRESRRELYRTYLDYLGKT